MRGGVGMGRKLERFEERVTDDRTCHLCHATLTVLTRTKEHIVPRSLGGLDTRFNTNWACRPCNSDKSNTWPWCSCNQCSRSRRRHWELLRITDPNKKKK
jgi:HNH endonuclease